MNGIVFLGDVHGQMRVLVQAMENSARCGIDTIVQVGDFWLYNESDLRKLERVHRRIEQQFGVSVTVHFIDGNHEDYRVIDPHTQVVEFIPDVLIYHPRGDVAEINGLKLGFFGGAVSIDQQYRIEGVTWFADEFPSMGDVYRGLESFENADIDVLVTHDIPEFAIDQVASEAISKSLGEFGSDKVREILQEMVEVAKPKLVIHGHWHHPSHGSYQYKGNNVDVLSLNRDGFDGSTMLLNEDWTVQSVSKTKLDVWREQNDL